MSALFEPISIGAEPVHRLLYAEFNRFQECFENEEERAEQTLRGGALVWWASFAPELVPRALERELRSLVVSNLESPNHATFGWFESVPMFATLAACHRNPAWLVEPLGNLAHHSSGLRRYVAAQLALAGPLLPSTDASLLDAVSTNIAEHHFFTAETLALYVASRGTAAEKQEQIARWCAEAEPDTPDHAVLRSLRDHGVAENPFAHHLLRLHRYVALRLTIAMREEPVQLVGPIAAETEYSLDRLSADEIWARMERHPLAGAYISVADVGVG